LIKFIFSGYEGDKPTLPVEFSIVAFGKGSKKV
jgi:hypothetical protein